jgi:murein L,D-transpeptidase YcbB/YkuD
MTQSPFRRRFCHALIGCAVLFCGQGVAADGSYPSKMSHYLLLERALQQYQGLARQPALTQLPPLPQRAVRPGGEYAGAAALRNLLIAVGDFRSTDSKESDSSGVMDGALTSALMRFQERHGLQQDGMLGPATWRALTTPMSQRVLQIERTLARWRSLPPNPNRRAIFINIPRFRLYAMNGTDDREANMLQMDVVVGKEVENLRTPVFSADMTHIIFRPYWDVPRSIALAELLPAIRKDPTYLARRDFEFVDSKGSPAHPDDPATALATGVVRVRQRPGPGNALGAVKFMLPNRNNVYLHDTPEKQLFARSARAFSHGCIRVSEPAALARWLLAGDTSWNTGRIAEVMNGKVPLQVNLAEPVRVYIVYGTAIAREDGTVLFLNDLYGLDKN